MEQLLSEDIESNVEERMVDDPAFVTFCLHSEEELLGGYFVQV